MTLPYGETDDYELLDPPEQVFYIKQSLHKTSVDFFGCELTDEEWCEFLELKKRIINRVSKIVDEELKKSIYILKTGEI